MEELNHQVQAAVPFLVNHIKRCFTALVDGSARLPRRRLAYWMAGLSTSARFWDFPIITKPVLENCSTLGIELGQEVIDLNGVDQFCAFLKAVEQPLFERLLSSPADEANLTFSKMFEPDLYKGTRFSSLSHAFSNVSRHNLEGVSIFLHGSMADLKFTAFSDVDDLVVVHKQAWQDPLTLIKTATALAAIARSYQKIDPYQHHGHWVITEFNLLGYEESILPLVVLNGAVCVTEKTEIPLRLTPQRSGFIRNAGYSIKSMQRKLGKARSKDGINAFELKGLVGEIAIMPAYIFQANGLMLSKPQALQRAGEIFSQNALETLAWATFVRDNFGPLVDNRRTKTLQTIANLTCTRRCQAETLFRNRAVRVSGKYNLGLNSKVKKGIEDYLQESMTLMKRLAN
jgi:hypothetical protein